MQETHQINCANGPIGKGSRVQTQWDEGAGHDERCCDRDGRDQVPQLEAVRSAPARRGIWTGNRLVRQQQQHDARQRPVLALNRDANAGATPRQHLRSRPTEVDQAGHGPPEPTGIGSSCSSLELTQRRGQILNHVKKLLKTNQLHGLLHTGGADAHEGSLGIRALLGKLNKGSKT